ncbi:MAG TPA: hypothetical protein VK402_05465 [Blastococcus sp.]|nr:hypothetical protein [Blastococcus sp.]
MTTAPSVSTLQPPAARPSTQRLRRLRLARALAGASVRSVLVPQASVRHRRRLAVCRAADTLTALGVRVRVIGPAVPWPRSGRVIVSDSTGRLGDLALATMAQGAPIVGLDLPGRTVPAGAAVCPVAVRYRLDDGEHLPAERVPTSLRGIAAVRGLVVELHLLPALAAAA